MSDIYRFNSCIYDIMIHQILHNIMNTKFKLTTHHRTVFNNHSKYRILLYIN